MPAELINSETLRSGLLANEFYLEYMPVVSLVDRSCLGVEALIRWRRPSGVVSPNEFIPIAENTQLSGLITYWVLDRLAEELIGWLTAHKGAYVSINVPPEILGRGGMEHTATRTGLIKFADQLVLEITERGVPDAMGVEALQSVFGSGVRVALDDVTLAGGANLAILARSQFAYLKLDRSLVAQIGPNERSPNWLKGLTPMLQSSQLAAIAEGVETELQADVLREAGVQSAQGFLFSHPLSLPAFFEFYERTKPSPATEPNPGEDIRPKVL